MVVARWTSRIDSDLFETHYTRSNISCMCAHHSFAYVKSMLSPLLSFSRALSLLVRVDVNWIKKLFIFIYLYLEQRYLHVYIRIYDSSIEPVHSAAHQIIMARFIHQWQIHDESPPRCWFSRRARNHIDSHRCAPV